MTEKYADRAVIYNPILTAPVPAGLVKDLRWFASSSRVRATGGVVFLEDGATVEVRQLLVPTQRTDLTIYIKLSAVWLRL
jgi:hypothetical protein